MPPLTTAQTLRYVHACDESVQWAADYPEPLAAWEACPSGEWLLRVCAALELDRRVLVLAALDCAELALPFVESVGTADVLEVVRVTRAWVFGRSTMAAVDRADLVMLGRYTREQSPALSARDAVHACTYVIRSPYAPTTPASQVAQSVGAAFEAAGQARYAETQRALADVVRRMIPFRLVEQAEVTRRRAFLSARA